MKGKSRLAVALLTVLCLVAMLVVSCKAEAPPPPPPPAPEPCEAELEVTPQSAPAPDALIATWDQQLEGVAAKLVAGGDPEPVAKAKAPFALALGSYALTFTGSGFDSGETVTIDLVVGREVAPKLKGVEADGEVGLAFVTADANGAFELTLGGANLLAIVGTILGALYDLSTGGINVEGATPIPAGVYTVKAIGLDSGCVGSTELEFAVPK